VTLIPPEPLGQPELQQPATPRLLLPTNRWNLLAFLTSGLVTPREGLSKYYVDLLEACPGRLPLLTRSCPPEIQRLSSSEDPRTAFPVLIEVSPSITAGRPEDPIVLDGLILVPDTIVDISQVVAVHFRNQAELDEHQVRVNDFANMPADEIVLRVSPELFEGEAVDIDAAIAALQAIPVPALASARHVQADRQSGAVLAALAIAPGDVALVQTLLGLAGDEPPEGADWLGLWWDGRQRRRVSDSNGRLFRVVCDQIWSTDLNRWRPSDLLQGVRRNLNLRGEEQKAHDSMFERMDDVLSNRREFERLRNQPNRAVVQALLLFLLRPDPTRLAKWESHGAAGTVHATAMYFAGLLAGRRALPAELRPLGLERHARALERAMLTGAPPPPLTIDVSDPDRLRVRDQDGAIVLERIRTRARLSELLRAPISEEVQEGALQVCREQGWDDVVEFTIELDSEPLSIQSLPSRRLRISSRGIPKPSFAVDLDAFSVRLSKVDPEAESEAMNSLRTLLTR